MAWEKRLNGVRGVLPKQPSPGLAERGRLRWWKSPLSHRPHHPYSRRRGPAAGREGAGRANFKPPACSSLPAPRNRLAHITGEGPLPDGGPSLSSGSPRSAPRRQPFPARGVSGPGLWEATTIPLASPPASPHRVVRTRRESWWWCNPLLLAGSPSCANLPPGSGSPLECAPGARPPACIPRAAGQPRLREWAGEVVGLLVWGMARVPAKPGIQGHDLKVSARCPFQSFDATSTPLSTLVLLC